MGPLRLTRAEALGYAVRIACVVAGYVLGNLLWDAAVRGGEFTPTTKPVGPNGQRVTTDLPSSQHHKNVGGSDGAGLCVYTSAWHACLWQRVEPLYGFRDWMRKRPGGSWPEKFDKTLKAYCQETGVKVPDYIQHTGGDAGVLELALKTGRMVCVTYSGRDDFYRGRVGHMVNLVYLDQAVACILDNNRPGTFLWMSRDAFLSRWRDMGGGWAIVFLAAPPPPYPAPPVEHLGGCNCKPHTPGTPWPWPDNCGQYTCPQNGGKGPCSCEKCGPRAEAPIDAGEVPPPGTVVIGQCSGGRCSGGRCLPAPPSSAAPLGTPPSPDHEWGMTPLGMGWRFKDPAPAKVEKLAEVLAADPDEPLTGVIEAELPRVATYTINGEPVTRNAVFGAMANGLTDDSDHWTLAITGGADFQARVRADLAALPESVRGKLNVEPFNPGEWQVTQFKLAEGVALRKPAAGPLRVGAEVGRVEAAAYSKDALLNLCPMKKPAPAPAPAPAPNDPAPPAPTNQSPWLFLSALAVAVLAMLRGGRAAADPRSE